MGILQANKLSVSYGDADIVRELELSIPKGKITSVIGPNGCGKSTLLKTLARMLKPKAGTVILDGKALHTQPTKEIAKIMAFLPQAPDAPSGLSVHELVSYGRFPYQSGIGRLTSSDLKVIEWALQVTGVWEFRRRSLSALSGGQRQRVWIAMALAQETELLLLDEPTTYLDLSHQMEVLQLLSRLNKEQGRTVAMVIHDLNLAARFSDYMVAVRAGRIICEGTPHEVLTPAVMKEVFEIDAEIVTDPRNGTPVLLTYDRIYQEKRNGK